MLNPFSFFFFFNVYIYFLFRLLVHYRISQLHNDTFPSSYPRILAISSRAQLRISESSVRVADKRKAENTRNPRKLLLHSVSVSSLGIENDMCYYSLCTTSLSFPFSDYFRDWLCSWGEKEKSSSRASSFWGLGFPHLHKCSTYGLFGARRLPEDLFQHLRWTSYQISDVSATERNAMMPCVNRAVDLFYFLMGPRSFWWLQPDSWGSQAGLQERYLQEAKGWARG